MQKSLHKKDNIQLDKFSMYDSLARKNTDITYKSLIDNTKKLLDAKYGSLFLEEEGKIGRVYTSNPKLYSIKPRKDGVLHKSLNSKYPFVTNITKANKKLKQIDEDINTVVSIPLLSGEKIIGVLTVLTTDKRTFTEEESKYLHYLGFIIGLTLSNTLKLEKVKHQLERRDLFISLAAHELKNPLTVIRAFAQLIANKSNKQEVVKPELANKIVQESGRISYLINELMQVGQIRKNVLRYQFRENSLRSLINSAIEDAKISHPDFPILFKDKIKDKDDYINGDYEKLMQVIINIINNAIKFSPYGSPIVILLNRKNTYFTVSIKDKGIGIAKEEQEKIFEEFHKAGAQKKAGLGLGLFIAKTIVENHNGMIMVKSNLGKGTTMEVRLPCKSNSREVSC